MNALHDLEELYPRKLFRINFDYNMILSDDGEVIYDLDTYKFIRPYIHTDHENPYLAFNIHGIMIHVHRLVYETFRRQIPYGYDVHHRDLDTLNNKVSNLELLTKSFHKRYHRYLKEEEESKIKRMP